MRIEINCDSRNSVCGSAAVQMARYGQQRHLHTDDRKSVSQTSARTRNYLEGNQTKKKSQLRSSRDSCNCFHCGLCGCPLPHPAARSAVAVSNGIDASAPPRISDVLTLRKTHRRRSLASRNGTRHIARLVNFAADGYRLLADSPVSAEAACSQSLGSVATALIRRSMGVV